MIVATPAARAGIHCLAVPTPFAIGPINAYLIEGRPLTLVDNGPNCATSLAALEAMLAELGHRVEDLELLILTHDHLEHFGLTSTLVARSGADVACLASIADGVEDFDGWWAEVDAYIATLLARHGAPRPLVAAYRPSADLVRGFGAAARVTRRLRDGERLDLGERDVEILHRPGHSEGDIVVLEREHRILIAGDHLLSRVSSNALVTLGHDRDPEAPRLQALLTYRESLAATRELDVDVVLGGHDGMIENHRELIDERFDLHDKRARRFAELLEDGPTSAHELAVRLWGDTAYGQSYLTLSETLGHLDLLASRGVVDEDDSDRVTRYSLR
jgi:glyoxylase-like metal-dependent hydrolase (beta-lactamase superfamily II)